MPLFLLCAQSFQSFKFRFKDVLWLAAGVQKVQRDVQGKLV